MKKLIKSFMLLTLIAPLFLLSSCSVLSPSPIMGGFYQNVKFPGMVATVQNDGALGSKVGTAQATSILGVVAIGDAGIQEAARNAGITRISHIDIRTTSILGVYGTYVVYVYGE